MVTPTASCHRPQDGQHWVPAAGCRLLHWWEQVAKTSTICTELWANTGQCLCLKNDSVRIVQFIVLWKCRLQNYSGGEGKGICCYESANIRVNLPFKDVTQTWPQRSESPTVTLALPGTRLSTIYHNKVHKFNQRHIKYLWVYLLLFCFSLQTLMLKRGCVHELACNNVKQSGVFVFSPFLGVCWFCFEGEGDVFC